MDFGRIYFSLLKYKNNYTKWRGKTHPYQDENRKNMPISRGNLSEFNRFPRLIDIFLGFLQDKRIFIQQVTSTNSDSF